MDEKLGQDPGPSKWGLICQRVLLELSEYRTKWPEADKKFEIMEVADLTN